MKRVLGILFIAACLVSFAPTKGDNCGLRYDGLYIGEHTEPGFKRYLRFYESGEVLVMESKSPINEILVWFKKEDEEITHSTYKVKNCELTFLVKIDKEKYPYEGTINGDKLKMFKKTKESKTGFEYNYTFKALNVQ